MVVKRNRPKQTPKKEGGLLQLFLGVILTVLAIFGTVTSALFSNPDIPDPKISGESMDTDEE